MASPRQYPPYGYDNPYETYEQVEPGIWEGQAPPYQTGGTAGPAVPPGTPPPATPPPAPPSLAYKPRYEGFEASKLGTGHGAKSPKYAFGDAVASGQYGYDAGAQLLKDLQSGKWGGGDLWKDWTYSGDKFRYGGKELADAWDGVDEVDFVRNFSQGADFDPEKAAFWWGVSSPKDRAAAIGGGGGGQGAGFSLPSFVPSGGGGYGGGSGGGASVGSSSSRSTPTFGNLHEEIAKLFPGGLFNQEAVTRRTSNAADALTRQRKSLGASNKALLAERGLIGSGPEGSAQESLDERLYDRFANEVNSIYANESELSDQRMMEALQIAAGLSADEARAAIDSFRAQSDRDLGFGNLALGNKRADQDFSLGSGRLALDNTLGINNYNLGLAKFGLDRDYTQWQMENGGLDQLIALIQQLYQGANTSAGGHV